MILNKGDDNPQDDARVVQVKGPAQALAKGTGPDLAAFSLQIVKNGSKYSLQASIKNNGPGSYTSGRTYWLQIKVNGTWTTLQTGAVPSLAAGRSMPLSRVLDARPAAGTQFRLILSAGDSVPGNDSRVLTAS